MIKPKKRLNLTIIAPLALLVVILVILELITKVTNISDYILPPPSEIIVNTIKEFPMVILPDFLFTIKIVLIGFISATVLGILLAALFSQFEFVAKATTPVVIWLVITPMITLIPLIMLWLGNNPNIRLVIVIIQASPIICLNTLSGFTNIENEKRELGRSIGATRSQFFRKVIFMNAMPRVFTGIKLGVIFSVIGSISSDFVAKGIGLGNRIVQYSKYVQIDLTYGCIIIVALIGIILYMLVESIEHRIVIWKK